jgi:beta-lactamase class A
MTPGVTRLTNRDLAALVVTLSDNSATNVLIDRVGMDNVNSWFERAGLKQTRLRRHMLDVKAAQEGRENTATPRELATMLVALYEGRALKKPAGEELLEMLSTPKSSYIPRLLPGDLTIANKPGNLDGVRNDAGIVYVPGRPFVIVVMTSFAGDGVKAEGSIARMALGRVVR